MPRRRFCAAATLPLLSAALPLRAHAGGQLEEPLADSVRTALSSAIANSAPPVPFFADTTGRMVYLRWLSTMSERLQKRIQNLNTRVEFLQTVWYESKRAGLETSLVLGLIQVESAFRKYAISSVGARGYMQIMPFWSRVIGDGDPGKLFHMQTNLRFGCVILRHYLEREAGILFSGDTLFAGSIGRSDLPGGEYDDLIRSILEKLLPLDPATRIFPGHGPSSTIGQERTGNPFLEPFNEPEEEPDPDLEPVVINRG